MFGNEKLKKFVSNLCYLLELIAAIFVFIGIAISFISLLPAIGEYWSVRADAAAFTEFLEKIMTVIIGVEFLKMLCRPNSDNIIETLIFVVARHMIINTTTPMEDLISTVSIVLLCIMRRYLKVAKDKEKNHELDGKDTIERIKEIVRE